MGLPEDWISKVISHQGEDGLKAVKLHDEVEFSGFGKFYMSQVKLKKKIFSMEKFLTKPDVDLEKRERITKYLAELKLRVK